MDKMREQKGRAGALRIWLLTAAAVMLVMSATMGIAWAYFTTYTTAKGGVTLRLGHEEHIQEYFMCRIMKALLHITIMSIVVFQNTIQNTMNIYLKRLAVLMNLGRV